MHHLNVTIDEGLYEKARAVSFLHKISVSELIRKSLADYINEEPVGTQAELLLDAEDEKEVLAILKENNYSTQAEFASSFKISGDISDGG